jgi:NAD(P)-dependent dehydrogenase (short-subunit alcohol dehydrogenase family)
MAKVALLGGTKGIGRALLRQICARGDSVALLGRDLDDLEKSANDALIRAHSSPSAPNSDAKSRVRVVPVHCDLEDPSTFASALTLAREELGDIDTVIVTAGLFAAQSDLEEDAAFALKLLRVNFAHTVAFCEEARGLLLRRGGGTLCVFSSVAGDRGRKPVVIYGASKAGLSAYLEGLDHKYRGQGLVTICVKPGFVKTGMTAGLKPPPFAGEPEAVARTVLAAIERRAPIVYTPRMWQLVMFVIRSLPRFVMRKINF